MRFPLRFTPRLRAQLAIAGLLFAGLTRSLLAAASAQELRWLDQAPLLEGTGATLGVSWPKGSLKADTAFSLKDAAGKPRAVQSWVLATWPDGSLKWTGHAFVAGPSDKQAFSLSSSAGQPVQGPSLSVKETEQGFEVDTGLIQARIPKAGPVLIDRLVREGREIAVGGGLVLWRQDQPVLEPGIAAAVEAYHGELTKVVVEQNGPVRAVLRLDGIHRSDTGNRAWLPFRVRLYFYAGSEAVRVLHTITFDGDEHKDFIRGLGLRFGVPMRDEMHNRHVRFSGEGDGVFAEAVRPVTGQRRDPGREVRAAQIAGLATPPVSKWDERVSSRVHYIPVWGDFTLSQLNADGFAIRKRTKAGHAWIDSAAGRRSNGLAYVGGVSGGLSLGMHDFWQKHPAQLDIRGAGTDRAELTAWLWAPDAQPMDMRFYHDGMGMKTHEEEVEAMNITYEDYEKGFGTPVGVARTSELMLWVHSSTPSHAVTAAEGRVTALQPQASTRPEDLFAAGVFGLWALPDRSTPEKAAIEDRNEGLIAHYIEQVDQRHWYGFWNYGDIMHTYDDDRQVWRYDVGGYAWDNSELSPDLWLWYSFLRTGKASTFRLAEAMCRHTGEVDVHHIGRFQGLGSRHNVQHWGCSAKQMRISSAAYRRFYYFLTADERTGDLLTETVDSAESFLRLDPLRKVRNNVLPPARRDAVSVGFGTDWGAYSAAMLTEWERHGSATARAKLEAGMRTIGAQPRGFFTGSGFMNIDTAAFAISKDSRLTVSHLSAVFGLPEMCAELLDLLPDPAFEKAWLDYCRLYNAPGDEQVAALGEKLRGTSLVQGHSRLTAYAAYRTGDKALLKRAWKEFSVNIDSRGGEVNLGPLRILRSEGPASLNPVTHVQGLSTNDAAQWGLAAIQVMGAEVRMKSLSGGEKGSSKK